MIKFDIVRDRSPQPVRLNKNQRMVNPMQTETSRSPSGLSKAQKSIGYSNDVMEGSPRLSKSPSPMRTPTVKRKDENSLKNLVFWNRNDKNNRSNGNIKTIAKKEINSALKNDAQILKEISTIIKKIQNNNSEKNEDGNPAPKVKQMKLHTLKPNNFSDKISEESTKTTFENNLSEKPQKNSPLRQETREEKSKMVIEMLKMRNNNMEVLDKNEIAKQFFNFKTQIDFFRNKNINLNDLTAVIN